MKGRSTMAPKPSTSSTQRSSSAGRQTLMGMVMKNMNESQRVGSIAKSYLNSSSKQETKALSDKNSQNNYIDNIFNYFLEVDFDHSLSVKVLKQPSSKLFFGIFNHLLNTIDPHLMDKNQLTEDKLLLIVKYIGYPYMLPKAVFVALTAPHTWPHLLCLLSWIVDLVKYKRSFLIEQNNEEELNYKKMIEEYISKSYTNNEEERFQKTSELLEKLDKKNNSISFLIKDYEMKTETLKLNSITLKDNQSELVDLDIKINQLNNQIATEKVSRNNCEKELFRLKIILEEKKEELHKFNDILSEHKKEIENIKTSINTQKMSKDQEEKIKSEITVQDQYRQILLNQKNEKNKLLSQISSKTEEIYLENDLRLRELNETIKKHPEIYSRFSSNIKEPNYQKLKDTNYLLEEIKKNSIKTIIKEVYVSNFKHSIAPQINEMIKKSTENKEKLQELTKSLQNEKEKLENSTKDFLEINRNYKTTSKKCETEITLKTEQLQKDNLKFEEKTKIILEEITNLKKRNEDSLRKIEKSNETINEDQNSLQTLMEEYETNKKFLENMKTQDMNKLLLLKNEVIQNLKIIDQTKKEYIQKFNQILEENK